MVRASDLGHTVTGASKKKHYLRDCSGVIFDVQKCSKILIFRGSVPDPTGGSLLGELTLLPYNLLEGTGCDAAPFPITPLSF